MGGCIEDMLYKQAIYIIYERFICWSFQIYLPVEGEDEEESEKGGGG